VSSLKHFVLIEVINKSCALMDLKGSLPLKHDGLFNNLRHILILPSCLCFDLQSGNFLRGIRAKILYAFIYVSHACCLSLPSHPAPNKFTCCAHIMSPCIIFFIILLLSYLGPRGVFGIFFLRLKD
jgi:hypothetical protein